MSDHQFSPKQRFWRDELLDHLGRLTDLHLDGRQLETAPDSVRSLPLLESLATKSAGRVADTDARAECGQPADTDSCSQVTHPLVATAYRPSPMAAMLSVARCALTEEVHCKPESAPCHGSQVLAGVSQDVSVLPQGLKNDVLVVLQGLARVHPKNHLRNFKIRN